MVVILNWIQIDKQIISMMRVIDDKDKLYEDVKQVFKWNDSQVEAAVGPLIKRWNWYDMHTDQKPAKKKRVTKAKTTKKAPAKKARATKKKS